MKKGKDLMISVDGVVYGYATDCSFDINTDTVEVSSTRYKRKTSAGKFKEFESDVNSVSLSSNYVLADSEEDYMTLVQHQLKGEPVDVSFVDVVDKDGFEGDKGATGSVEVASTGMRIWGKALITAISLSAPTEGESTFQVSLQGTGAWSVDKIGEESASA